MIDWHTKHWDVVSIGFPQEFVLGLVVTNDLWMQKSIEFGGNTGLGGIASSAEDRERFIAGELEILDFLSVWLKYDKCKQTDLWKIIWKTVNSSAGKRRGSSCKPVVRCLNTGKALNPWLCQTEPDAGKWHYSFKTLVKGVAKTLLPSWHERPGIPACTEGSVKGRGCPAITASCHPCTHLQQLTPIPVFSLGACWWSRGIKMELSISRVGGQPWCVGAEVMEKRPSLQNRS